MKKTGIRYPKDYNIKNITLLTTGGTIDLKPIFVELSYFEDLFGDTVSGQLVITDTQNLIEKLHISGNEYVRIKFTKGSDNSNLDIDVLFRVFKVSNRGLVGNLQTEGYILHLCSEELVLSEQYKVNKSYRGKRISEIVDDIFTNYLKIDDTSKVLFVEKTKGVHDFIIPFMKPFEAINWLSNYAQADAVELGSDMLFFENKDGYHFRSLQSLFKQKTFKTFVHGPKNLDDSVASEEQQFYGVISYEFKNMVDTLDAISSGIFANRLISIDPLVQTYYITDFDYNEYFKKSISLNKHPITNSLKNRKGDMVYQTPQSVTKLAVTNADHYRIPFIANKPDAYKKDMFVEKTIPNRTSQLVASNYNRLKLVINGDPTVVVGEVVNFNLHSIEPTKRTSDDFYSGRYLVSAVKHIIKIGGYNTVVELVKESVPTHYASAPETPIWKNTVKGKT